MYRLILGIAAGLLLFSSPTMAACTVPNTLTNGTTADATAVMGNFTSIGSCAASSASPSFTGTVSSSGIVGIGSSLTGLTGLGKLNVVSSTNASNMNSATNSILIVHNDTSTPTGAQASPTGLVIARDKSSAVVNGDYLGGISWNARYDSEDRAGYANISAVARGSGVAAITFNVPTSTVLSPVEAMRIDYNGNVGIMTSSPSYTLHVNGSVAGTSAYNNLSDTRLKKNVVPLTAGLSLISQLQPVRFEWRGASERSVGKNIGLPTEKQIGFIAQDLNTVLPEAVSTAKGKDAIMSVAESKIVPVLVAAVKELKAANDNQRLEITQLRTQVESLERSVRVRSAAR